MKRFLLLLFVALVPCLTFVSCEKDSDDDTEQTQENGGNGYVEPVKKPSNKLEGTTWYTKDTPIVSTFPDGLGFVDFKENNKCEIWLSRDASGTFATTMGMYTYSITGDKVSILQYYKNGNDLVFIMDSQTLMVNERGQNAPYLKYLQKK